MKLEWQDMTLEDLEKESKEIQEAIDVMNESVDCLRKVSNKINDEIISRRWHVRRGDLVKNRRSIYRIIAFGTLRHSPDSTKPWVMAEKRAKGRREGLRNLKDEWEPYTGPRFRL